MDLFGRRRVHQDMAMTQRVTVMVAVAMVMATAGCKRNAEPPAGPLSVAASAIAQTPPGGGLEGVNRPLSQLLGTERLSRPTGTPRAEQVFSALQRAGLTLTGQTQVLGRVIGASYCENAHTSAGVVFSVCEFKDTATAEQGREYSLRAFGKALPNRRLLINIKTLLTIAAPAGVVAAQSESEKGAAVFEGVSG